MTFQLDTSGHVLRGDPAMVGRTIRTEWSDLSPFTQGYVEALFADDATQDALMDEHGRVRHGFSGLAPEALARIIADCGAYCRGPVMRSGNETAAGHIFWEHRQKGYESAFPPLRVGLTDSGKVVFE